MRYTHAAQRLSMRILHTMLFFKADAFFSGVHTQSVLSGFFGTLLCAAWSVCLRVFSSFLCLLSGYRCGTFTPT